MAANNAFCALCGVPIENHFGGPVQERLLWTHEVRAIRTRAYLHDPFVTGVGYMNFQLEVCAHTDEDVDYFDAQQVSLSAHELMFKSQQYWCFPVHDVCWRLLRWRVDPEHALPVDKLARHLWAILYNTPTDGSGVLTPGHDYGGAARFQDASRADITASIYSSEYFYLSHDPRDEFDFQPESIPELTQGISNLLVAGVDDVGNLDAFSSMPSEIITMILEELSSKDLGSLRLASKYVAAVSHSWLLPQSFWLSRFRRIDDMAFVFADRMHYLPPEPLNWRQLYAKARTMLREPKHYPGFQNRHRIWKVLGEISPALSLRLSNNVTRSPYGARHPMIGDGISFHGIAAADLAYEHGVCNSATAQLDAGVRLFEKQVLVWSSVPRTDIVVLGASFVYINRKTYVSGIRLLEIKDSATVECVRAGFIDQLNEERVELDPTDVLDSFQAHVTMSGIIGFRLVTKGQNGLNSYTLGQMSPLDSKGGVAELANGGSLYDINFLVGLDACKLVSIELLVKPGLDTIRSRSVTGRRNVKSAEIWIPEIPEISPQWHSPVTSERQAFNMCLSIDIEKAHLSSPESLTMVNMFMGEFPAVFVGMSFVWSNGYEQLFGCNTYKLSRGSKPARCVVQSFPIAGSQGELITRIETSYSEKYDTIQMSTNAGRSVTFRLRGTGSLDDKESITDMTTTPEQVFTRLFVRIKSPTGHFRDFTARIIATEPNHATKRPGLKSGISHELPITPVHMVSAEDMLAYPGGFAFTSATVSNIRKIRISMGRVGSSRGKNHISGLWIEYYDSDTPLILGQWITELGSFEMAPGERLTEFSTWHDFTNRFSSFKFGPIVGVRLASSSGAVKEYHQQCVDGKVYLQFRENPYENLHGIIWGCNHQWDHVRVLNPARRNTTLLLTPLNLHISARFVPQRIFWTDYDPLGNLETVSAVEVSYKDMSNEPSGIAFIYPSGRVRVIGYRGVKPQSEPINEGDSLVALELWVGRGNRIGSVGFYTDKGKKLSFVHDAKRTGHLAVHKTSLHVLNSVALSESVPLPSDNTVEKIPQPPGQFAGFWAVVRRQDGSLGYPMLGPIFERRGLVGTAS